MTPEDAHERALAIEDEIDAELEAQARSRRPRLLPASVRASLQHLSKSDDRAAAVGVLLLARLVATEWGEGVVLELASTDEGTLATMECVPAGWWIAELLRVRHETITQAMGDLLDLLSPFAVSRQGTSLVLRARGASPTLRMRPRSMTPLELPSLQLLIEAGLPGARSRQS